MNLTFNILLACDVVFAFALLVYMAIRYAKIFNKRSEPFALSIIDGQEAELTYEEEKPSKILDEQKTSNEQLSQPINQQPEPVNQPIQVEDQLNIGSIEDLEKSVFEINKK